ncbi:uncharacterized protein [Battus philenor]|uniref:uncharacterized protein n=1 Tax=Battus philenor TaxID=42288 RepID=UPI0035D0A2EE
MFAKVVLVAALVCAASCIPLDNDENDITSSGQRLWKRFIDPSLVLGDLSQSELSNLRTKRSEEECEKLQLCKLHARSGHSFFAAYQLYFVNKENARLWDHQSRSIEDCERRFGDCYR